MSETTATPPISILPVDDSHAASRARRSIFCFGAVLICLTGMIYLGKFGSGPNAEHAIDGLASLAEVVAFTYLGVSTVDRSGLLANIGQRLKNGPAPTGGA